MKTSLLVATFLACSLATPIVSAQKNSVPAKSAMGMEMNEQMPQMQENMKKMQQQMESLQAATDPKERQRLMQEHMQTMQDSMKAMHRVGGPMMSMMGGKGGGSMMNMKPKQREDLMQGRMDMMEMMMEQMLQHDQMLESMPAK